MRLAAAGKKDSGIGGVGTGAGTATKLLRRYGSIAVVEAAAARGELAGWSPAVQRLFPPGGSSCSSGGGGSSSSSKDGDSQRLRQLLMRNRQLFAANRSPEMLAAPQREEIVRRAGELAAAGPAGAGSLQGRAGAEQPSGSSSAAQLAWAHPTFTARWRRGQTYIGQLAAQLREQGAAVDAQAATPAGLPVDILVQPGGGAGPSGGADGPLAVLVAGPGDLASAAAVPEGEAAGAGPFDLAAAAQQSPAVLRQLHAALQLHARLLRKEGLRVVCVPWWRLPAAD